MDKIYGDDYNKNFDTYAKGSAAVTIGGMLIGTISKGIAKNNQKKAEEIYNSAQDNYMASYRTFEENSEKTKKTIINVVNLKKHIMGVYIKEFLRAYQRLAPQFILQESQGIRELQGFTIKPEEAKIIRKTSEAYLTYSEQGLGNKAGNIALLMVQEGTVSNLAYNMRDIIYAGKINDNELKKKSMDELRVQSIGVIAQFSTVAVEFGVSGVSEAFASGKKLNEAKEAAAQFKYQKELLDIKTEKIIAIDKWASCHLKLLNNLGMLMDEHVAHAVQVIKSKDNIFHLGRIKINKFTRDEIGQLAFACALVEKAKIVIDSPIISKDGDVFLGDKERLEVVQNFIETAEKRD